MDVVCVGDCGVDLYLPSGERLFGGITANVARHARREFDEEDSVCIVSCIGDDKGSELVLSSLQGSGIECDIERLAGRTPVQTIEIQPDGEKRFTHYDEGVLRDFRFTTSQTARIAASDLMVAPVYLQIVGLFDELMAIDTHGSVAIDFADFLQHPDVDLLDRHIERIDIGFFGLRSEDRDMIDAIADRAAAHDKLFVVTLGADGSIACHHDEQISIPAVPVDQVVDTTGAGDAYAAGFLSRLSRGAGIQESMERGAELAARVIGTLGSQP
jgi:fructoselysine 6-kinase